MRGVSLMVFGLVAHEAIDYARLGHAEREPRFDVALQRDVELGGAFLLIFSDALPAIELELEGKLAHQRLVVASGTPQRDIALGEHTLAEVQLAERQQHLLDNAAVYQGDFLPVRPLQLGESRKRSGQ